MSERSASEMIRAFRERLNRDTLPEGVTVVYRVAGGMPHERIEHEFRLTGAGEARVQLRDELTATPPQEAADQLEQGETRDLLEQIGASLEDAVPRSEARFLPDSTVGSITLIVDGEEQTLFFLADEEQRVAREMEQLPEEEKDLARDHVAASPITQTARHIDEITQRLLGSGKEQGNE
jgi:hypothetical protein